jgi:hypothetical protein
MISLLIKKWKGLQQNSYEEAKIHFKNHEIHITSLINFQEQGKQLTYQLDLNKDWTCKKLQVQEFEGNIRSFCPEAEKPRFVDFEITPLTNALPVNFLKYHQYKFLKEPVLLIRYPLLQSEVHTQCYRILKDAVKYQNFTSGFQSEIIVDEDGFVAEYTGLFVQV